MEPRREGLLAGVLKVKVGGGQCQEGSSSLDQEEPGVKEEEEENEINKITFSPVPVKSEEDEVQSSQLHHSRVKEESRDAVEPKEPDSDPHLEPDDLTSESSETDISDGDWGESSEPQCDLNSLKINTVSAAERRTNSGKKLNTGTECGKTYKYKNLLQHEKIVGRERLFTCSECGCSFARKGVLKEHMRTHAREKPFSCSKCGKTFSDHSTLNNHIKIHSTRKRSKHSVSADSQGLVIVGDKQQEELCSLDQGSSCIKQEDEEVDINKFIFSTVKSEDDVENIQSSQLHHSQTEEIGDSVDGEDCRGPEGDPDPHLQTGNNTADSSETDASGGDEENRNDEKKFSCSECGNRFVCRKYLKRHMMVHTGEKPYICSVCNKSFIDKGLLNRHMRIHSGEKPYTCFVCNKSFNQNGNLKSHMRIHTGEKPFSCSFCHQTFTHRNTMKNHQRFCTSKESGDDHDGDDNNDFHCPVCETRLNRRAALKQHMMIHTGEKPYSCSVCNKLFREKGNLKCHMRIHTGEMPYSCSFCKRKFSLSGTMKCHQRVCPSKKNNDNDDEKQGGERLRCSECGKRFGHRGHLKIHMMTHTREKPYICSVCSQSFTEKRALNVHMRRHTGEKPYSCSMCNKSFIRKCYLTVHMRTHTKEKPYSCPVCSKSFKEKGQLKTHLRIHTGEKPHVCSMCSKSFSHKGSLETHTRIHTGEKPYSCSLCMRKFSQKHHLKNHRCVCL